MGLSFRVCWLLVGATLLPCGCSNGVSPKLPVEFVEIPGSLNCLVLSVSQKDCIEFFDRWRFILTVRLKIKNCTCETLTLKKLPFEARFSETEIYVRGKDGSVQEFTTMGMGRIGLHHEYGYAVRNLKPSESCVHDVECSVVAFERNEMPVPDVELEWFFPSSEGWFGGEMLTGETNSVPCEFKMEITGVDFQEQAQPKLFR